jgi:hypothetical protein
MCHVRHAAATLSAMAGQRGIPRLDRVRHREVPADPTTGASRRTSASAADPVTAPMPATSAAAGTAATASCQPRGRRV